ncbi:MAG: PspA/IM30 family protein [Proteobacteria bacterium]|jgi:phage shock protein A|nr:PspA/IM30 family protein [Pseudomonadota bacterium]
MRMFKRVRDIFTSNVNSALDKIEDPAKMIALMIRELEETETKAKASMAQRTAELTTLAREKAELSASAQRWDERAKLAISRDREELAREALVAKKQALTQVAQIEAQEENLIAILASQSTQLTQIADKLSEVKEKRQILIHRAQSAKERNEVAKTLKKSDSAEIAAKFSELETKIERMEADAKMASWSSSTSTGDEFAKMERDAAVEEELAKLKAAAKKKAPKEKSDDE